MEEIKVKQQLFHLILNDREAGPYTLGQVQCTWKSGAVTAETLYFTEGKTEWQPLRGISDLLDETQTQARIVGMQSTGDSPHVSVRERKASLFRKIVCREDAVHLVRLNAGWCIALSLGALILDFGSVAAGLEKQHNIFQNIGAVISLTLGVLLWVFNSRAAAVTIVVMNCIGIVGLAPSLAADFNGFTSGALAVGLLLLALSIRAVEAAFKLHGSYSNHQ